MTVPIVFEWSGQVMVPLARQKELCERQYITGEQYALVEHEDRSQASHDHYFARIAELWENLPERYGDRWPTSEHLRKHALIWEGYRDERSFVASSKAEALRIAAFLKPADEYAVVLVRGATVIEYRAKSQSKRAMGSKQAFEKSKQKVLGFIENLIGIENSPRSSSPPTAPVHSHERVKAEA